MKSQKINKISQQELLKKFLFCLFPKSEDIIEIRPCKDRKEGRFVNRRFFRGASEFLNESQNIISICNRALNGCHFGVLPRIPSAYDRRSGKREDIVSYASVIWCDIDDKDTGGSEQTKKIVDELPITPSAIIKSGGGIHIYYFLNKKIATSEIERFNKALIAKLNGDKNAWDSPRILRLPTSIHNKKSPKMVFFEYFAEIKHDPLHLELMLQEQLENKIFHSQKMKKKQVIHSPFDIKLGLSKNVIDLMMNYPKLVKLYQNCKSIELKDNSPSGFDWAFCQQLRLLQASKEEIASALWSKINANERHLPYDGKKAKTKRNVFLTISNMYNSLLNEDILKEKKYPKVHFFDDDSSFAFAQIKTKLKRYPNDYHTKYKQGKICSTLQNLKFIIDLMNLLSNSFCRFNEFTSKIEIYHDEIQDHHLTKIRLLIAEHIQITFPKEMISDVIDLCAIENSYHPVRQIFENIDLKWNLKYKLQPWLKREFKIDKFLFEHCKLVLPRGEIDYRSLIKKMFTCWMISGVARIIQPGSKVDCALILMGPQGIGKSTLLKKLALNEEYFSDSPLDIRGGRDTYTRLQGKFIIEFAELSSMKQRDSDVTKAFLSASQDTFRAAYARFDKTIKRQVIFAGSTNEREIFRDVTGDRRYYPIPLLDIKIGTITEQIIEKLWADAIWLYNSGVKWHLNKNNWMGEKSDIDYPNQLISFQAPYRATDTWIDNINIHIEKNWSYSKTDKKWKVKQCSHEGFNTTLPQDTQLTISYLLENVLGIESSKQNRAVIMRLAGLLSGANWQKRKVKNRWTWFPPPPVEK